MTFKKDEKDDFVKGFILQLKQAKAWKMEQLLAGSRMYKGVGMWEDNPHVIATHLESKDFIEQRIAKSPSFGSAGELRGVVIHDFPGKANRFCLTYSREVDQDSHKRYFVTLPVDHGYQRYKTNLPLADCPELAWMLRVFFDTVGPCPAFTFDHIGPKTHPELHALLREQSSMEIDGKGFLRVKPGTAMAKRAAATAAQPSWLDRI